MSIAAFASADAVFLVIPCCWSYRSFLFSPKSFGVYTVTELEGTLAKFTSAVALRSFWPGSSKVTSYFLTLSPEVKLRVFLPSIVAFFRAILPAKPGTATPSLFFSDTSTVPLSDLPSRVIFTAALNSPLPAYFLASAQTSFSNFLAFGRTSLLKLSQPPAVPTMLLEDLSHPGPFESTSAKVRVSRMLRWSSSLFGSRWMMEDAAMSRDMRSLPLEPLSRTFITYDRVGAFSEEVAFAANPLSYGQSRPASMHQKDFPANGEPDPKM